MFSRILIEQEHKNHPLVQQIQKRFSHVPVKYIHAIEDIFGRVKKPYLYKNTDLQLFLGKKKGQLIKEAPPAYGQAGEKHYYFIHAYNCIYECEYCYLQGYFNSPDIVLFINHDEIIDEMEVMATEKSPDQTFWMHAGEFSDSLALSHVTKEIPLYHSFLKKHGHVKFELRTKSANIKELEKLSPLPNLITSFSLSPEQRIKKTDLKTPSLLHRLKAMEKLASLGHPIAIHLDPVIHEDQFQDQYKQLFKQISDHVNPEHIEYVSIGVVRFTHDVYRQVTQNYPHSDLLAAEFITSFDKKVRYPRPFRLWLLGQIKELAIHAGFTEKQLYLCME